MTKNSFCHIEISALDLKRAQNFYRTVFDWNFESVGNNYLLFNPPNGIGGTLSKAEVIPESSSIIPYIDVNDIEKHLVMIVEHGGTIFEIKTEIPNIGWFAKFKDTEGNLMGLLEEYVK